MLSSVDEAVPVEVIHVPTRARAHEAGRHHLGPAESALLIQRAAVHEPAGALAPLTATLPLHHQPLGETPHANADLRR
ncbi:MAG: hypothetical protein U0Y82_02930 [Thermoleophilia bacterium]